MAFEEALSIAREKDVDFILLGGDLFHENRPSPSVEHKCIKIIRQHMSTTNRPTSFKRISGSFSHFHKLSHGNFEDPNFTIPHPIITIHGNHDDPTGPSAQSICEKLATCGLLNYFGAINPREEILVEPIVLEKGNVRIALYGMGFIPDWKLRLAFEKKEVTFAPPPDDSFNVLVVHQNRVPFLQNKVIPDEVFPTFFHLIIRGHEHNAMEPEPIPFSDVEGIVYQPGSTVATSISCMEAKPKRVAIFSVKRNHKFSDSNSQPYRVSHKLIKLECCRSMLIKDISQREVFKYIKTSMGTNRVSAVDFKKRSQEVVEKTIYDMLKEYRKQLADSKLSPEPGHFDLPLMRIRLEYCSKNERFDEADVSLKLYPQQVVNKDVILFKKQKLRPKGGVSANVVENITFTTEDDDDEHEDFDYVNLNEAKRDTIDVMIENYFKKKQVGERLEALSLQDYTEAVTGSNEQEGNVISKVLNKRKTEILEIYKKMLTSEEVCESRFSDLSLVSDWFKTAFHDISAPVCVGGDEDLMEVVELCE